MRGYTVIISVSNASFFVEINPPDVIPSNKKIKKKNQEARRA
jgi:hypothetical protein